MTLVFQFPEEQTTEWFIRREFIEGAEGKAYHVFNADGKQAVFKFILKNEFYDEEGAYSRRQNGPRGKLQNDACELSLLQEESKYWININDNDLSRIVATDDKYVTDAVSRASYRE